MRFFIVSQNSICIRSRIVDSTYYGSAEGRVPVVRCRQTSGYLAHPMLRSLSPYYNITRVLTAYSYSRSRLAKPPNVTVPFGRVSDMSKTISHKFLAWLPNAATTLVSAHAHNKNLGLTHAMRSPKQVTAIARIETPAAPSRHHVLLESAYGEAHGSLPSSCFLVAVIMLPCFIVTTIFSCTSFHALTQALIKTAPIRTRVIIFTYIPRLCVTAFVGAVSVRRGRYPVYVQT